MECSRCGIDHLADGTIVDQVPEYMCRGALWQELERARASFKASNDLSRREVSELKRTLAVDETVIQEISNQRAAANLQNQELTEKLRRVRETFKDSSTDREVALDRENADLMLQRDALIDGIREGLTLLQHVPSTPELCAVAKAIQAGVQRMDAVTEKQKGDA